MRQGRGESRADESDEVSHKIGVTSGDDETFRRVVDVHTVLLERWHKGVPVVQNSRIGRALDDGKRVSPTSATQKARAMDARQRTHRHQLQRLPPFPGVHAHLVNHRCKSHPLGEGIHVVQVQRYQLLIQGSLIR